MKQQTAPDKKFKFKFVEGGRARGLSAKKGTITQTALILNDESISYSQIADTTARGRRLLIALSPQTTLSPRLSKSLVDGQVLVLEIQWGKALELERAIDSLCSMQTVLRHKQQLIQIGQGAQFQAVRCPECNVAIDITGVPPTPYLYCRFCETIFAAKKGKDVLTKGDTYHVCDECGMFGRIRGYTEFYFYFLLVAYGFSYKQRFLCDSCAHRMFVKTLLTNLIFILGVPFSIYAKLKSLGGREASMKNLGKASALSRAGKYQQAAPIYEKLYLKHPYHPGLLMNEGIGHLRGNDVPGAIQSFEQAMKACGNYLPVMRVVRGMQQAPSRVQRR
jgi:hypothetical protein